jgi:hypothetical protein
LSCQAKCTDAVRNYTLIQIKLVDRTGGPAATSGPAQLALTNHDKESFNFGAMAEPSVLPLALRAQPERNTSERFDGG